MSTKLTGGLYVDGMPVFGTFPTQGNTYYVRPRTGSDGNNGKDSAFAFATLAQAKAAVSADQNDTVFLFSESNTGASTTDYQSAALDWSKDGTHIIGVGSGVMIGQRARIAQLSTVKTIEDLFTVSADNCLISNIEVFQGVASGTQTAGRAVVVSGQRNNIVNCQLSGAGDVSFDDAGARSLAVSGSENIFKHCYIGLDTVIRSTQAVELEVVGTAGSLAARNIFEDCLINTWTSADAFLTIKASYVDRFVLFKNCTVSAAQGAGASTAPAAGIATANMNGRVLLHGTSFFGFDNVTSAGDSTVLISGYGVGSVADVGLANATVTS